MHVSNMFSPRAELTSTKLLLITRYIVKHPTAEDKQTKGSLVEPIAHTQVANVQEAWY